MSDVTFPHGPVRETTVRDDTTYLSAMLKRTAWGAVFAGAFTAISLQMLFTVLGIAVGATAADIGDLDAGIAPQKVGIAAGVWWLVTGAIALFLGGCVVGRFAGMVKSPDVLLHSFVMWAVTAIFGFAVLSSGTNMALNQAVDSYLARTDQVSGSRVVLTADTGAPQADQAVDRSQADIEESRRLVRNASWWTLMALLSGIAVSLAGAWLTAPHRIVVRPTTAHD